MDKEVALDVAVEVRVTWKIGMKHKFLDAMILRTHLVSSVLESRVNHALSHPNINEK